jgi:predicted transcriptional regulator
VLGIVERDAFIKTLSEKGQGASVVDAMRRDVPEVDTHEMVESALSRLEQSGAKTLPVVHSGQLAGLITSENITEFLMIRSALRTAAKVA